MTPPYVPSEQPPADTGVLYERCPEVSPTTGERCVRKVGHHDRSLPAAQREHRAETPGFSGYTYWQDGTGHHGYSHHPGWQDWSVGR